MRNHPMVTVVLLLAITSCSSAQPELKVRASSSVPQVEGVGEAEAQLALGNVGLALEGFRNVLRNDPGNVRAAVGMANCYESIGRFDLSRNWFETALASAPQDSTVLYGLAASLQRQGKLSEAASVRAEAHKLASDPQELAKNAGLAETPTIAVGDAVASVTIQLPPPMPSQATVAEADPLRPLPISAKAEARSQPHLERLSLGEVALITRSKPRWTAEVVQQSPTSVTFRWVPVRPVARLLNAARQEGLAARTRATLAKRGWNDIEIGDAPAVRAKTLVLYPEDRRGAARKLAAQFGFTHLQSFSGREIVVLLGRDAAALKSLRPA